MKQLHGELTRTELQDAVGLTYRKHFLGVRDAVLAVGAIEVVLATARDELGAHPRWPSISWILGRRAALS